MGYRLISGCYAHPTHSPLRGRLSLKRRSGRHNAASSKRNLISCRPNGSLAILRVVRNTGGPSGVFGSMGTQIVGVVVANFVVLLATDLAFDAWVRQTLGYLDLDMVGVGGVLWVALVVVATTLVAIGFAMRHLRWAAAVVILGLAFILVDHAIGALRDGEVSTAGAVTGSLMVVQLITLVLSLLVASRRGRASHLAAVVVLGIGAIVLVSGGLNAARTIGSEPRATVVRSWRDALANDPVDRGWWLRARGLESHHRGSVPGRSAGDARGAPCLRSRIHQRAGFVGVRGGAG